VIIADCRLPIADFEFLKKERFAAALVGEPRKARQLEAYRDNLQSATRQSAML
jgi:hypothetical protein